MKMRESEKYKVKQKNERNTEGENVSNEDDWLTGWVKTERMSYYRWDKGDSDLKVKQRHVTSRTHKQKHQQQRQQQQQHLVIATINRHTQQ